MGSSFLWLRKFSYYLWIMTVLPWVESAVVLVTKYLSLQAAYLGQGPVRWLPWGSADRAVCVTVSLAAGQLQYAVLY